MYQIPKIQTRAPFDSAVEAPPGQADSINDLAKSP